MARQDPDNYCPTALDMLELFARRLREVIDEPDIEHAHVILRLIRTYAKEVEEELQ